jgi:hypothetical protein
MTDPSTPHFGFTSSTSGPRTSSPADAPGSAESSAASDEGQGVVHRFRSPGPIHLNLQNLRGDISVRAGSGPEIQVELIPHGRSGRALVERMTVRLDHDRLVVDAPASEAHSVSGALQGLFGSTAGSDGGSGHGATSPWSDRLAEGLRSVVRGAEGLASSLTIWVSVPADSRAVINAGAGDIEVAGRFATLDVKAGTGDLRIEQAAQERSSLTTGTGDITVARAETGTLTARTGLGDVAVRIAPGTAAHLDLATGFGERDVRLTPTAGAGAAQRTLTLEARSGKGDLRVTRATS